ncbi:MAG: SDR family oxidoreductase [Deltaproteobacteria bacterium]|nr:SDR family oxidoreductase [Deltaproteobacteria bacterium]
MRRFDGKVALVTGAASGIGRATAQRLVSEGASVLCCDVNEAGLQETLQSLAVEGRASAQICDVSDVAAARTAVAAAVQRYGGLDVLCNVAGIGRFQHTAEVTPEEWGRTLAINLSGTFYLCQAALPHLLERRGAIVNIASSAGLIGQAYSAAYCASKGGVVQLTKALAVEFARKGLRVNCVCPGGIMTPLLGGFRPPPGAEIDLVTRLKLVEEKAEPSEVAGAVAYLASEEARYVNGAVLSIDAGMVVS